MKYRILLILMVLSLLPAILISATLSVKQDGSGDYTIIQEALDAANPGDTVLVHPGRYYENLEINESHISLMSLEGISGDTEYIDTTIIDGNESGRCIRSMQNNISIRGFCITNGFTIGAGGGISISEETIVTNCNVFHNKSLLGGGINIIGASATLKGVKIYNNYAHWLGGGSMPLMRQACIHCILTLSTAALFTITEPAQVRISTFKMLPMIWSCL